MAKLIRRRMTCLKIFQLAIPAFFKKSYYLNGLLEENKFVNILLIRHVWPTKLLSNT